MTTTPAGGRLPQGWTRRETLAAVRDGHTTVREVAEYLGLTPGGATYQLQAAYQEGLLGRTQERTPPGVRGGPRWVFSLTPAGSAALTLAGEDLQSGATWPDRVAALEVLVRDLSARVADLEARR